MRRRRHVGSVLLVGCAAVGCGGSAADRLPAVEVVELRTADAVALDSIDGPAVVNLWATWCAPCRREMPAFEQVHRERGDEVAFVGVNIGDTAEAASAFVDELGVTFAQYLDVDGATTAALGTASLPVTIVVDDDGTVVERHVGPWTADELRAALDER